MQNLLTSEQMRAADAFTIAQQQISSLELMESASLAFVNAFTEEFSEQSAAIAVLCGKGNNGGDGLAIARLLRRKGYTTISVYLIDFSSKETPDYQANLNLLKRLGFSYTVVKSPDELSGLNESIIIDAVLGSGLNKPLQGNYLKLAMVINQLQRSVIAVDVPTGFPAEGPLVEGSIYLKADLVICFQRPKINFFFPESVQALSRFRVVNIGLDEAFIEQSESAYQLMNTESVYALIKPRLTFTHKGTYGHALIVAGQQDTMGAALLSAMACLHAGAGLTTASIPPTGLTALNTALPEVMYLSREELLKTANADKFKAIAVGPGLGTGMESQEVFKKLLDLNLPLVIDADALNILAENKELLEQVSSGSVLTPHMKEFDHLFGTHKTWWERLQTGREQAVKLDCIIVLKNQYTFIVSQKGMVTINPTGNPAMAQGGMGDILTGLIVSFLAQGYSDGEASSIACFVHGSSGDELALQQQSVTASQVALNVSKTIKGLVR
jgi:hydroxyethylthiazole kinase-like uncharacterized protein yjeF